MSNRPALVLIALATACAAGCGRMQSVAPHQAAERLATAARTALGRSAAPGTGKNDVRDLAREMAVQRQLADTQAQGRYKAAVARCAALGGETRRACAEEADAEYEIAEAKAQLATAQADPLP